MLSLDSNFSIFSLTKKKKNISDCRNDAYGATQDSTPRCRKNSGYRYPRLKFVNESTRIVNMFLAKANAELASRYRVWQQRNTFSSCPQLKLFQTFGSVNCFRHCRFSSFAFKSLANVYV
jgi:hypothetical protein